MLSKIRGYFRARKRRAILARMRHNRANRPAPRHTHRAWVIDDVPKWPARKVREIVRVYVDGE